MLLSVCNYYQLSSTSRHVQKCSTFQNKCGNKNENFLEWKITPSHLINKYFGKSFKFHLCLSFNRKLLIKFPKSYKNILFQWSSFFFASTELPSCILSNFLCFNKHVSIEIFFVIFLTMA